MNAIDHSVSMALLKELSLQPMRFAKKSYPYGVCGQIVARSLFTIQLITSCISLPIILLLGFGAAVFHTTKLDEVQVKTTLKATVSLLSLQLFAAVPTSLLGIVSTEEITTAKGEIFVQFAEKIAEIFHSICRMQGENGKGSDERSSSAPLNIKRLPPLTTIQEETPLEIEQLSL